MTAAEDDGVRHMMVSTGVGAAEDGSVRPMMTAEDGAVRPMMRTVAFCP